jgi:hypothetical protein
LTIRLVIINNNTLACLFDAADGFEVLMPKGSLAWLPYCKQRSFRSCGVEGM